MGRGTRKPHLSVKESSSRRRPSKRVRAAAKRMDEGVKSSISPEPGRKKYTVRLPGKCANPRVRRWFLIDWIQKIVPVDLIDFAGKLSKKKQSCPLPEKAQSNDESKIRTKENYCAPNHVCYMDVVFLRGERNGWPGNAQEWRPADRKHRQ